MIKFEIMVKEFCVGCEALEFYVGDEFANPRCAYGYYDADEPCHHDMCPEDMED